MYIQDAFFETMQFSIFRANTHNPLTAAQKAGAYRVTGGSAQPANKGFAFGLLPIGWRFESHWRFSWLLSLGAFSHVG